MIHTGRYDGRQPLTTANTSLLFASLVAQRIPARYLQLDPYWYTNGARPEDVAWRPAQSLYGARGLAGLVAAINNTKLLLYHNFWGSATRLAYPNCTAGLGAAGGPISFTPSYRFRKHGQTPGVIWQVCRTPSPVPPYPHPPPVSVLSHSPSPCLFR